MEINVVQASSIAMLMRITVLLTPKAVDIAVLPSLTTASLSLNSATLLYGSPEGTWCDGLIIRPNELIIRSDGLVIRPDNFYNSSGRIINPSHHVPSGLPYF